MGRKKIERRIKRIALQVQDEVVFFDLNNEEKLEMLPQKKEKILKRMNEKIQEIISSKGTTDRIKEKDIPDERNNLNNNTQIENNNLNSLYNQINPNQSVSFIFKSSKSDPNENCRYLNYLNYLFEINNRVD